MGERGVHNSEPISLLSSLESKRETLVAEVVSRRW